MYSVREASFFNGFSFKWWLLKTVFFSEILFEIVGFVYVMKFLILRTLYMVRNIIHHIKTILFIVSNIYKKKVVNELEIDHKVITSIYNGGVFDVLPSIVTLSKY